MEKRRIHSILLLAVCIFMQIVAVYPHHHHRAGMVCLHHDAQPVHSTSSTSKCGAECVTHFNLSLPGRDRMEEARPRTLTPYYIYIALLTTAIGAEAGWLHGYPDRNAHIALQSGADLSSVVRRGPPVLVFRM